MLPILKSFSSHLPPIELYRRSGFQVASPFSFIMDGRGWLNGRYSLFGGTPFGRFQSDGAISRFDHYGGDSCVKQGNPLEHLQIWLDRFRPQETFSSLPFLGGAVGFFSYNLVRVFETMPIQPVQPEGSVPDIDLIFIHFFVLYDHEERRCHVVYNPYPEIQMGCNPEDIYREGCRKRDEIVARLQRDCPNDLEEKSVLPIQIYPHMSRDTYLKGVDRILKYIAEGDIFQANFSQSFYTPFFLHNPFALYKRLCQINPSPFSAYLEMGAIQIAGNSPERLVKVQKVGETHSLLTSPIAGTQPRGATDAEDQEKITCLMNSPKERAEHLMLVDLERNDLGKVCRYGSVRMEGLMTLERYSHLYHLVSHIRGEAIPKVASVDILKAVFPGGTITGVPKIRCMQIIAELEKRPRGIYTGSVGYFDFAGEMEWNIVIRTWIRNGGEMTFHVGSGIVADSDPEAEYAETLHKAAALIQALEVTF